jgi:hypothetical protein
MSTLPAERRAPRWSTRLSARYGIFDGRDGRLTLGRLDATRACDLGARGLFLAHVELPVGTRLHVFFALPETSSGCVELFGEVVHTRPRLDSMGHEVRGVGVRIRRISPRDRARLDAYLAERRTIAEARRRAGDVRARAEQMRSIVHTY